MARRAIVEDVRDKLAKGAYKNEEHVRVCIVLRMLQALGWNIWNPAKVNLEFPVLPNEDQTKVDVALFLTPHDPVVRTVFPLGFGVTGHRKK
jgi:predicted type IV restriction endonuclease